MGGYAGLDYSDDVTDFSNLDDYSDLGSYSDPTSLSTVYANPSISSTSYSAPSGSGTNYSGLLQSVGNVGATIASVVTGNPVAVSRTGTIVGAAGSTTLAPGITSGSSGLILLLGVALVLFLVLRKDA